MSTHQDMTKPVSRPLHVQRWLALILNPKKRSAVNERRRKRLTWIQVESQGPLTS